MYSQHLCKNIFIFSDIKMATGFYDRVVNTVISGSSLRSELSSMDNRALEFDASLKSVAPFVIVNGRNPLFLSGPLSGVEYLMQAAISSLPLDMSGLQNDISAPLLDMGPDAASQASAYTVLFDLKTTSDVRILRMFMSAAPAVTGGNAGLNLTIGTFSGTSTYLKFQENGAVSIPAVQLFNSAALVGTGFWEGTLSNGEALVHYPGSERIILVSSPDLRSGQEKIVFNVLSQSL